MLSLRRWHKKRYAIAPKITLLCSVALLLGAQRPVEDAGKVFGTIVSSMTGMPIGAVDIRLSAKSGLTRSAVTAENGQFVIDNIPQGTYRFEIERNGFNRAVSPLRGPESITLSNKAVIRVVAGLYQPAVITGQVNADTGELIANSRLIVLHEEYSKKGRVLRQLPIVARTDDFGNYRIGSLHPGSYIVCAYSPQSQLNSTITCSPNTVDVASALPVTVDEGALGRADITLRQSRLPKVEGVVIPEGGEIGSFRTVFLVSRNPMLSLLTWKQTVPNSITGKFEIPDVPPGSYDLFTSWQSRLSALVSVGRMSVEVGSESIDSLQLAISHGIDIPVHVKFSFGDQPPNSESATLTLAPTDGLPSQFSPAPINVNRSGDYVFNNVQPGAYDFEVAGLSSCYVSRASLGSENILGQPVRIDRAAVVPIAVEVSSPAGTIDVEAVARQGEPEAFASVALLPSNVSKRRGLSRFGTTDENGHIRFVGLEPGDYKLLAWSFTQTIAYYDPAFLQAYEPFGKVIRINASHSSERMTVLSSR